MESSRPEASANSLSSSLSGLVKTKLGAATSLGQPRPASAYWQLGSDRPHRPCFHHRWVEKRSCPAGPIVTENNGSAPLWIKATRPKAKGKGKGSKWVQRQRQGE